MFTENSTNRAVIDIRNILFELGIIDGFEKNPPSHKNLRDDLGLDSQELVSLVADVSSLAVCHLPLHEENLTYINDLIKYLNVGRDTWLPTDVQYVLQGSAVINQDIDTVFSYISNYDKWPEILQHVKKIETEFEDGRHQCFTMHIEELTSHDDYYVKTWRYVNQEVKIIDFTQVKPPAGFRLHKGGWRFIPLESNQTMLVSYHGFDLENETDVEDSIKLIRRHIQAALRVWTRYGNDHE